MSHMILTTQGHSIIATAMKNQQMSLAWGGLPEFLQAPSSVSAIVVGSGGSLVAGNYSYVITATTALGETLGSIPANVVVSTANSSVTLSWAAVVGASGYKVYGRVTGSIVLLASVAGLTYVDTGAVSLTPVPLPLINSTSYDPWTTTPPLPNIGHTKLLQEIGRRKVTISRYVIPDSQGAYVTSNNRWSESLTPTPYLYIYCAFDLADAAASTIFQFGVFTGTVIAPGHENSLYLTPEYILDGGSMLALENVSPIYRNSSTREIHEIVMTF